MTLSRRQNVSSIVLSMVYNNDNTKLAVSDTFKTISITDLASEERKKTIINLDSNVATLEEFNGNLIFTENQVLCSNNWENDKIEIVPEAKGLKVLQFQKFDKSIVILTTTGEFYKIGMNSEKLDVTVPGGNFFKILNQSILAVSVAELDKNFIKIIDLCEKNCVKEIPLRGIANTVDFQNHFALVSYKDTTVDLIHIYSGEVVTCLEEPKARTKTHHHTAKYHHNGSIITSHYGSNFINIFDSNGRYRRSLQCDFNTSSIAIENGSNSIAVGGFSSKIELFHDLVFKSEILTV